uniref:Microtubule-associated protein n=1 Tax=Timema monikensis TaxID=170555 RepID=A0A7R9EJL3_9NEOP|nr:unnamed protein product [Timema monikensis]
MSCSSQYETGRTILRTLLDVFLLFTRPLENEMYLESVSSPKDALTIATIESQKLEIKAESKVGSLSNVKHKPGGGEKKIFDDKTYLKQISSGSSEGRASGIQTPEPISPSHSHHSSQLIAEESQQQS